jgi:hypothetical protein
MSAEQVEKITAIIYYLYFHKKMFPHSIAGSHKIEDVFDYACELLLNMDPSEFDTKFNTIYKELEQ